MPRGRPKGSKNKPKTGMSPKPKKIKKENIETGNVKRKPIAKKSRKQKSIFTKNGFKAIVVPHYMLVQIEKAYKSKSFLLDSSGKKAFIAYKYIVDDFFRDQKAGEYVLCVKENDTGLFVMVRTGFFVGTFTNTTEALMEWKENFYKIMAKDSEFIDYR